MIHGGVSDRSSAKKKAVDPQHATAGTNSPLGPAQQAPDQDELVKLFPPVLPELPRTDEPEHLFTDGSCSKPPTGRVFQRTAWWAVRLADPHSDRNTLLAAGLFPGRKQTAYRSKLFAVACALANIYPVTQRCIRTARARAKESC